jgi:Transposase IS200 like
VLRQRSWGQHLWARGYWVSSSSNVTDEVWKKYIEDRNPEASDYQFKACGAIDLFADRSGLEPQSEAIGISRWSVHHQNQLSYQPILEEAAIAMR